MTQPIESLHAALTTKPDTLTIGAAPLVSPAISEVITTHFAGRPVIIAKPEILSPAPDQVTVTGTTMFRGSEVAVTATFAGETVTFRLRPPANWLFSQWFPELPSGVDYSAPPYVPKPMLDRLQQTGALSGVEFVIPAQDPEVLAAKGLGLIATLHTARLSGVITLLAGSTDLLLRGGVIPPHLNFRPPPGIRLEAQLSTTPALPSGLQFSQPRVFLHTPPSANWPSADSPHSPVIGWRGEVRLGDSAPMPASIEMPLGGSQFSLWAEPRASLASVDAIGIGELASSIPTELAEALGSLTLESVQVSARTGSSGLAISYLAATVATAEGTKWTLVDDLLAVERLAITFGIADPFGRRQVTLAVFGTFDIAGADCEVSVLLPHGLVGLQLAQGETLPLGSLLAKYLPGAPVPADLVITDLGITTELKSVGTFAIEAAMTDHADFAITVADVRLALTEVSLRLNRTPAGTTGALRCAITVAGVDIEISATCPTADAGWEFAGQTRPGEKIRLGALLAELLEDGVTPPQALAAAEIEDLHVRWNSKTGDVSFGGKLTTAWDIDLGPRKVTVQVGLEIQSSRQHGRSGRLTGMLDLGGQRFRLEYGFAPGRTMLAGSWQGDGAVTYQALADALGIDTAGIPVGPSDLGLDLGLREVGFELDLSATGKQLVFTAKSTVFGKAFVAVLRDAQSRWGFALAVEVPKDVQLPSEIGDALGALDWLSFSGAMLVLSSSTYPDLRLPSGATLAGQRLDIRPGLTCALAVDFAAPPPGGRSAAEIKHMRRLTGKDMLIMQFTLGRGLGEVALEGLLDGGVTLFGSGEDQLRLSNTKLILYPAAATISIAGTIALTIDNRTFEASGQLAIGIDGISAALNITSGNAYLGTPLGFKGVHLTEMGVMLDIGFAGPSLGIGLAGSFVIGGPPDHPPESKELVYTSLTDIPKNYRFAFVLAFTGPTVRPQLLNLYLADISLDALLVAILDEHVELPDFLGNVRATEVLVYWCDSPTLLPNRTMSLPGFAFNGNLDLWGFRAHASLSIDRTRGVVGDAYLDPIHIPGVLDLTGASPGSPADYQGSVRIAPGGPIVHVSTAASPYFKMNWNVTLFSTASSTVDAEISNEGIRFKATAQLDSGGGTVFASELSCVLKDFTRFEMRFVVALNLDIDVGVLDVSLGKIHLVSAGADIALVVSVESGFLLTLDGTFMFEGESLTLPHLELSIPPGTLEELPGLIARELVDNAEQVFGRLFASAKQIISDGLDKAGELLDEAATSVSEIADDAVSKVAEITSATEQFLGEAGDELTGLKDEAAAEVAAFATAAGATFAGIADQANAALSAATQEVERQAIDMGNAVVNAGEEALETAKSAVNTVSNVVGSAVNVFKSISLPW